jgi:hypothetical protein
MRSGPRRTVHIGAVMHTRGERRRIDIVEYSSTGLSLDRAVGIELGQRVTIELRSGERLPMRVDWVKGAEAGVLFLGPIAPEHTVMRSLEEAAESFRRRKSGEPISTKSR